MGKACGGRQGGSGTQRGFGRRTGCPQTLRAAREATQAAAAAQLAHQGAPGRPGRRGRGLGGRHVPSQPLKLLDGAPGPASLPWVQEPGPPGGSLGGAPSGGLGPRVQGNWGHGEGAAALSGAALAAPQGGFPGPWVRPRARRSPAGAQAGESEGLCLAYFASGQRQAGCEDPQSPTLALPVPCDTVSPSPLGTGYHRT